MNQSSQNSKAEPLDADQRTALALNEQGFLLAQAVKRKIQQLQTSNPDSTAWRIIATELPVTAADGTQTRIDLVISGTKPGVHLAVECKRPNPKYKEWIFFDPDQQEGSSTTLFTEHYRVTRAPIQSITDGYHRMVSNTAPTNLPIYNAYSELAQKQDGKWSHTETIENSLRQVLRGHTGLMTKLIQQEEAGSFRSIPVIVTTAPLFAVDFDHGQVDLSTGTIDAISLKRNSLRFCGVNYNGDDTLGLRSQFSQPNRISVNGIINRWHRRTIFVVNTEGIQDFLTTISNLELSE